MRRFFVLSAVLALLPLVAADRGYAEGGLDEWRQGLEEREASLELREMELDLDRRELKLERMEKQIRINHKAALEKMQKKAKKSGRKDRPEGRRDRDRREAGRPGRGGPDLMKDGREHRGGGPGAVAARPGFREKWKRNHGDRERAHGQWKKHHKRYRGLCGITLAILLVVHILLTVWVYTDIRGRNSGSGIWITVTLLTGLLGAAVYALVRIGDARSA